MRAQAWAAPQARAARVCSMPLFSCMLAHLPGFTWFASWLLLAFVGGASADVVAAIEQLGRVPHPLADSDFEHALYDLEDLNRKSRLGEEQSLSSDCGCTISPIIWSVHVDPLQHLCESTSKESSLVTEPPKKAWKPSSGPSLPKPPKKLPTAADPNSIRNLYKEKTWIEHNDSYNPPPLEFKGPGPGLTANCRGLPSMLHLFGLLWTRHTKKNCSGD